MFPCGMSQEINKLQFDGLAKIEKKTTFFTSDGTKSKSKHLV